MLFPCYFVLTKPTTSLRMDVFFRQKLPAKKKKREMRLSAPATTPSYNKLQPANTVPLTWPTWPLCTCIYRYNRATIARQATDFLNCGVILLLETKNVLIQRKKRDFCTSKRYEIRERVLQTEPSSLFYFYHTPLPE